LEFLYKSPVNLYLSFILLSISVVSVVLGIRRFTKAYQCAGHYVCASWFIRGIRWVLISLTTCAWAASFYWNQGWLFIIGLVIICQELYEGVIISLALRHGEEIEKEKKYFLDIK